MYDPYVYGPEEIESFLREGREKGASHLVIGIDRFDYNEWHEFVIGVLDAAIRRLHKPEEMQEVYEIYDIATGKKSRYKGGC